MFELDSQLFKLDSRSSVKLDKLENLESTLALFYQKFRDIADDYMRSSYRSLLDVAIALDYSCDKPSDSEKIGAGHPSFDDICCALERIKELIPAAGDNDVADTDIENEVTVRTLIQVQDNDKNIQVLKLRIWKEICTLGSVINSVVNIRGRVSFELTGDPSDGAVDSGADLSTRGSDDFSLHYLTRRYLELLILLNKESKKLREFTESTISVLLKEITESTKQRTE